MRHPMAQVPFIKAHGCGNDFLIVSEEPVRLAPLDGFVRRICDRHCGVGADGLYLLAGASGDAAAEIHLYNCDGSPAELSGNGTRCVAAVLVAEGQAADPARLRIRTGAGLKELRLLERDGNRFRFEMHLGGISVSPGPDETLAVGLGNPHCVAFVERFGFDWEARGRALERHPQFPDGANVEFVRVIESHRTESHRVEARFWERGAGHTLSSGTGAAAAAVAAIHAGRARSPVTVSTEGGDLEVRWEPEADVYLTGPAEIVCRGEFCWEPSSSGTLGARA